MGPEDLMKQHKQDIPLIECELDDWAVWEDLVLT